MRVDDCRLALLPCPEYSACRLAVAALFTALKPAGWRGRTVLVKPNLVLARNRNDPACTHPAVVRAVCEHLLDLGACVLVGDSPAFGSARQAMEKNGTAGELSGLPVRLVDFDTPATVTTASGCSVGVARAALECDLLVNLPKLKAHGQLLVTLAVKNLFGVVVGWRKQWLHMRMGDRDNRFARLIVDLLPLLPEGLSLIDGIVAMHRTGPMEGEQLRLGILAGALNPVAADTGLLSLLRIDHATSPVWRECAARGLAGSKNEDIIYPLTSPEDLHLPPFEVPERLQPIRFNPRHIAASIGKRLMRQ